MEESIHEKDSNGAFDFAQYYNFSDSFIFCNGRVQSEISGHSGTFCQPVCDSCTICGLLYRKKRESFKDHSIQKNKCEIGSFFGVDRVAFVSSGSIFEFSFYVIRRECYGKCNDTGTFIRSFIRSVLYGIFAGSGGRDDLSRCTL